MAESDHPAYSDDDAVVAAYAKGIREGVGQRLEMERQIERLQYLKVKADRQSRAESRRERFGENILFYVLLPGAGFLLLAMAAALVVSFFTGELTK